MSESTIKSVKAEKYSFLSGGGEMGKLIRATDWNKTPLGDPGTWPQSLRTMVSVMLDNPFGMYIAWGKEYTQIYNDGYRPILGSTKHPQALGISTRETFAEIWHIIESMFDGVMNGVPVGFPDFMLQLDRNGYIETCYFDFAYSPIRMENGEVGGVLVTVIETTGKKKAVEDLEESEERFRTMAEATDIYIAVGDESSNATYFNNAWVKLTGRPMEELLKFGWLDLVHPEDRDRYMNIYLDAFKKREAFTGEFRVLNSEGEYRWLLAQGPPRFRPDGSFAGYISSCVDITNQKHVEIELKESKDQLLFAIEAAELGTWDYDPVADKLSANNRLKAWFGFAENTEIELADAVNVIDESDRQQVTAAIQKALQYDSGGNYDIEYTIIHPVSKKETIVHAKGRAWFNEDKIAYRLNGTLEDITEQAIANSKRKETEQHIRTMVLESPVGICVMDAATLVSEIVNESFIEIAGKPHDAIVGKFFWDTFAEARAYYEEPLNKVVETGNPFYANEVEMMLIRHGKEDIIYVTFVYAPLKDENGKVIKIAVWLLENTMQVEARKKIMISENNLRLMILQAPMAISILRETDYKVEVANKYALELWGRTEEQVMNLSIFESMPELSTQGIKELLDDVASTGNRFATAELPVQLLRKGTLETVYINFSYEPLYDADEKINGIMAIGFDVTQQVEARKKVEESEQRFRNLIAQAIHPIFILRGEELALEIANDSLFKLWRVGPEAIGKPFLEILPEMKEQPYYDLLMDVYRNGVTHTGNEVLAYFNRPNGEEYSLYFNFIYLPFREADGNISGVLVQAYEVTEQVFARKKVEESEQRTRSLVESAPFPIAVYEGKEMRIALANQSVMDIWGKGNDVVGKLYTDILPELVGQKIFEQVAAVLETGIPFHAKNQKVDLIKNGALGSYYFNYSFTPLFDASGVPFAVMNTAAEVTELHEAKQKVEESEKRFRDSVQQAPLGIAIFRGPDFKVELANDTYLNIIDRSTDEFIGHPIFDALPEIEDVVAPLFSEVISTGIPFYGNEFPASLKRMGKLDPAYFNFVYHPLKEESGEISGIMVVATEVTATVKAKQLLEESEKHFRHMVMQSPIPMTILRGKDFIIESANKVMFENMWRKKEADVLGKSILEVFPELYEQKYPELLNEVITSGKSHTEKEALAYVQGDDGMRKFYLDFEYAPLFEPDGRVSGIMITVNDVTDKVEARKKVEEAEERTRLAAEATELSTWELDLQNPAIIHSPRLAVIFGHDESTTLTHPQMRSQIHPEDIHDIVEKAFDEAMITGVYKYAARVVKPDNTICWIRTQGKIIFDENKNPLKMVGTLRDITEEKQYQQALLEREQKFRLLADSMPQHIWTADPEGNLNYFNQSVYDYSGLRPAQLEQDGWLQIVHPDDREENINTWMDTVTTGKDFLLEHRFRRYDGEYRWQLSRAIPQRDADGNIQMWVGSSTDIQNIKEQEQQKDFFISMASHELKTPVTSIKGYVQILQTMYGQGQDSFLLNSLKVVDRQIITLTKLISELLDISKIKSGGLDLNKETFEITDLIEEVTDGIKQINPDYEITIAAEKKVMITADRDRISQVLINFLTNAIKYAPDSKKIHIKSFIENNEIVISVEDYGIGISKAEQEKIFERFYRVEGKNEKTFPGFGIGLFISSEIINKHGGKIGVNSELSKGSVFYFSLPIL